MVSTSHHRLPKPVECTPPRVNCNVNWILVIMTGQCRSISSYKSTSLVGTMAFFQYCQAALHFSADKDQLLFFSLLSDLRFPLQTHPHFTDHVSISEIQQLLGDFGVGKFWVLKTHIYGSRGGTLKLYRWECL